uniref:Uncharacterized protein n=1 Tax=Bracon brevicornis TaxID=1563983 RepID=A0A6V7JH86_9HYME
MSNSKESSKSADIARLESLTETHLQCYDNLQQMLEQLGSEDVVVGPSQPNQNGEKKDYIGPFSIPDIFKDVRPRQQNKP